MNINGVNGMNGLNGVSSVSRTSAVKKNSGASNGMKAVANDQMDISGQNRTSDVKSLSLNPSEVRVDLVNRVRSEIAAGTYYSDAKLEAAMNKMFESFVD